MPLPTPNDNESEDDFISRCMENPTSMRDFPDRDQRLAVCFDQAKKVARKLDSNWKIRQYIINSLIEN